MICSREELQECLTLEKKIYYGDRKVQHVIAGTKNQRIYRYLCHLRHEEFYGNCQKSFVSRFLCLYHKRRKNKLGCLLGFDIPANCFGKGLCIHHVGGVVVNGNARIGENCDIAGDVCIGSTDDGVPTVGNNCRIGYGAILIGDILIADDCTVGAGAVVTKSCVECNSVLVGIPARVQKK